jgi:inner membrane transporter RhtA
LAAGLFHTFAPTDLAGMRVVLAGAVLLVVVRPSGFPTRAAMLTPIALGAAVAAQVVFHYEAISRIPLASAVAIGLSGPITVAVVTSRRWLDAVPIVVVIVGLLLLLGSPQVSSLSGVVFELASAACMVLYLAMLLRLGRRSIGLDGLAVAVAVAGVALAPLGLHGFLRIPNLLVGGKLVAIGALSTAPYAAELSATRVLPVGIVGLLICADPVAAAVLGFLILHQAISLQEGTGILCVIVAGVLAVHLPGDIRRVTAG